jgi:hypothetical protein
MNNNFYNRQFGKIIFFPWILAYVSLALLKLILFLPNIYKAGSRKDIPSKIIIEAGIKGWESIEFKELQQSAIEYLSEGQVVRLEINKDNSYIKQVLASIKKNRPSHFMYDPRTGSQNSNVGFIQAFVLAHIFLIYKVIPISLLTDLSIRKWRLFSATATAWDGITITFMHPKVMHPIFPHSRLIGPCLMPFSKKLLEKIELLRNESTDIKKNSSAIFTGSLYEPRHTTLKNIQKNVAILGGEFEILGRPIGSTRVDDRTYWKRLINNGIIVTTATQISQPGTDMTWVPHLLYRYLEVLSCGSLLIAHNVPGINRYFVPGIHFIDFESEMDAAEKILLLQKNSELRKKIANQGHLKAKNLINSNIFWASIDSALGNKSLI